MNAHAATPIDRRAERTHLFLVATLYCGRASNPVRVRNLSASGALVEGAALPADGTAAILRRGALEAPGTIVWSQAGKAGLAFTGLVNVAAWLPVKEAKGQTQVDKIAFGLKHSPAAAPAGRPTAVLDPAIVAALAELVAVQAQIRHVSDRLGRNASVTANHSEVQMLDAAEQRIDRIVAALRAPAPR